jgi:hypothetical protein
MENLQNSKGYRNPRMIYPPVEMIIQYDYLDKHGIECRDYETNLEEVLSTSAYFNLMGKVSNIFQEREIDTAKYLVIVGDDSNKIKIYSSIHKFVDKMMRLKENYKGKHEIIIMTCLDGDYFTLCYDLFIKITPPITFINIKEQFGREAIYGLQI